MKIKIINYLKENIGEVNFMVHGLGKGQNLFWLDYVSSGHISILNDSEIRLLRDELRKAGIDIWEINNYLDQHNYFIINP